MSIVKHSFGIICYKRPDTYSFLMVKKCTTYCFNEFVLARYDKHYEQHLITLFNGMTYHEKIDILSLKFANMWYRIYKENFDGTAISSNYSLYMKKKSKFDSSFLQDDGKYLRYLIAKSQNVTDTSWEFPRGRRRYDEMELDIAIREFHEETGISPEYYKIRYGIKPFVISYKDYGVIYKSTYYFAESVKDYAPVYRFDSFTQMSEIAAVKWVNKLDLIAMDIDKVSKTRLLKQFDIVKKIVKNHTKLMLKELYISSSGKKVEQKADGATSQDREKSR